MKTIENSFPVNVNLKGMSRVVDLIYCDGPLLSQYVNDFGDSYLFYWVDVDDEFNRWLVFRTTNEIINNYVEKKITLYDVVTNPCDGFVYMIDVDNDVNYRNTRIVYVDDLPNDYKPKKKSFYKYEPVNKVDVSSISKKNRCGILELHVSGDGVGYGSISANKLGPLLVGFEDVRKSLCKTYLNEYKKANHRLPDIDLIEELNYDYIGSLAGSFRALFRPKTRQLACGETDSDIFASMFIEFLKSGEDKTKIPSYGSKYGAEAINKYSCLMESIISNNVSLDVKWSNCITGRNIEDSIDTNKASFIFENLKTSAPSSSEENIKLNGSFFLVNLRKYKFGLENEEDHKPVYGDFEENTFEKAMCISLDKVYEVDLIRYYTSLIGRKAKPKYRIINIQEKVEQ